MDNFVKFGLIVLGAVVGAVLFVGLLVWMVFELLTFNEQKEVESTERFS